MQLNILLPDAPEPNTRQVEAFVSCGQGDTISEVWNGTAQVHLIIIGQITTIVQVGKKLDHLSLGLCL